MKRTSIYRYGWVVPLVLTLVLTALAGKLSWTGEFRDDVAYVAAAKSLAQGRGYGAIERVNGGLQDKYPPGYPFLLLPAQLASPDNIVLLRSVTALFGSALVVLLWWTLPRFGPEVAVLMSLNVLFLEFNSRLMSEVPFTFFTFCVLAYLHRLQGDAPPTGRDRILLALCVAAAIYIRTVGVVLLLAVLVGLRKHGWRQAVLPALYAAAFYLPHFLGVRAAGYQADVEGHPGLWIVLKENALVYLSVLPGLLTGDPLLLRWAGRTGWELVPVVLPGLLFYLLLVWAARKDSGLKGAESATVLGTIAIFLLWPFQYARFFLPVLPLLYRWLLCGAEELGSRFRRSFIPRAVLAGLLITEVAVLSARLSGPGTTMPESYSWLSRRLAPGEVVASIENGVWLHLGHQVFPFSSHDVLAQPEPWLNNLYLFGADYVAVWRSAESPPQVVETINLFPHHLRLEYSDPVEAVRIYRVVGDAKNYREAFAWARRGLANLATGATGQSVGDLRRSIEMEPAMLLPRILLAEALIKLGHLPEARTELLEVLRRTPNDPRARSLWNHLERG